MQSAIDGEPRFGLMGESRLAENHERDVLDSIRGCVIADGVSLRARGLR